MTLDGKVALVTGGASGIGAATCAALADAGGRVVAADVDEAGGRVLAARVGGELISADVADPEADLALVAFAESAIVEPIRPWLTEQGYKLIPPEEVAAAVLTLFTGDMAGECWFVQTDREPVVFRFRNTPGPGKVTRRDEVAAGDEARGAEAA